MNIISSQLRDLIKEHPDLVSEDWLDWQEIEDSQASAEDILRLVPDVLSEAYEKGYLDEPLYLVVKSGVYTAVPYHELEDESLGKVMSDEYYQKETRVFRSLALSRTSLFTSKCKELLSLATEKVSGWVSKDGFRYTAIVVSGLAIIAFGVSMLLLAENPSSASASKTTASSSVSVLKVENKPSSSEEKLQISSSSTSVSQPSSQPQPSSSQLREEPSEEIVAEPEVDYEEDSSSVEDGNYNYDVNYYGSDAYAVPYIPTYSQPTYVSSAPSVTSTSQTQPLVSENIVEDVVEKASTSEATSTVSEPTETELSEPTTDSGSSSSIEGSENPAPAVTEN